MGCGISNSFFFVCVKNNPPPGSKKGGLDEAKKGNDLFGRKGGETKVGNKMKLLV